MDDVTHKRAEILAEEERRSISNLLTVLIEREWKRLHPEQPELKMTNGRAA